MKIGLKGWFLYDNKIEKHLTYASVTSIEELDEKIKENEIIYISTWKYVREITPQVILTKQEIADKLNIDINLLTIKEDE